MEIIQNRYNQDRVLEKINSDKIRVIGESEFSRTSVDGEKRITMYDFEGGPCLTKGGFIKFKGMKFKINSIKEEKVTHENLTSIILEVSV